MSTQEVGSHLSPPEQSASIERRAVQTECQEACHQLDREVCLTRLVDQLGIQCSDDERVLLIPALLEKERTLPKLLTDFPLHLAKAQIVKLLPGIRESVSEQALDNTQAKRVNVSEALVDRQKNKAELAHASDSQCCR